MGISTRLRERYKRHLEAVRNARRLLSIIPPDKLGQLWWKDMPFRYAITYSGFLRSVRYDYEQSRKAEGGDRYGVAPFYELLTSSKKADSAPTVWNHKAIQSKPWFDEDSQVKAALADNIDVISAEYYKARAYLREHPENADAVSVGRWNSLFLFGPRGELGPGIESMFPSTLEILSTIPLCTNFGFVLFSELKPGTHIVPHTGSSNLRLRHHLCIEDTGDDLATIRVAGEQRSWKRGDCLAFDDSYEHEVRNNSQKSRTVLIVDTWHPSIPQPEVTILSHPIFASFGRY